jgi:hypothetical protein
MTAIKSSVTASSSSLLRDVVNDTPPFWDIEREFDASLNNRKLISIVCPFIVYSLIDCVYVCIRGIEIDCYNRERIEAKLRPITFKLIGASTITNPRLEAQFTAGQIRLTGLERNEKQLRSHRAFHGTHPRNIDAIATNGLLRIGHPLNPSKSTSAPHCTSPLSGV